MPTKSVMCEGMRNDNAIFWIGGGSIEWSGPPNSDFRAIEEGYISVSPLHLDVTHQAILDDSESWWLDQ